MPAPTILSRLLAVALSLALLPAPLPASETLRLRWSELSPAVAGKQVWLTLPQGARVSGTVREVTPSSLQLEISKTSDRQAWPKDLASIPRTSVSSIRLTKPAGHKGLIIGALVGGAAGTTAGASLAAPLRNEGTLSFDGVVAAAIFVPIGIGILVGALVDWAAHARQRQIIIQPE